MNDRPSLSRLFTWRTAICDSDLRPVVRHVCLTLSLYMSERGDSAFPGATRLTHDTGLAKRTVLAALGEAEAAGWLRVKVRGSSLRGGRRTATEYAAAVPTGDPPAPVTEMHQSSSGTALVHLTTPTGDPPAPQDVMKTTESAPLPAVRKRDELFDVVAEVCGIDPGTLTPSARGAVNRALAELRGVGADPVDVRRRAAIYGRRYPHASLTPPALAKHWPQLHESFPTDPVARAAELARRAGR